MSLSELIPLLKPLSYKDKLLLLHYLATALLKDADLGPLNPQSERASQGLHNSFDAAAVLAQALTAETTAIDDKL